MHKKTTGKMSFGWSLFAHILNIYNQNRENSEYTRDESFVSTALCIVYNASKIRKRYATIYSGLSLVRVKITCQYFSFFELLFLPHHNVVERRMWINACLVSMSSPINIFCCFSKITKGSDNLATYAVLAMLF